MAGIIQFSQDQLSTVEGLRNLADQIESGAIGADSLAWVIFEDEFMSVGLYAKENINLNTRASKSFRFIEGCRKLILIYEDTTKQEKC